MIKTRNTAMGLDVEPVVYAKLVVIVTVYEVE